MEKVETMLNRMSARNTDVKDAFVEGSEMKNMLSETKESLILII